MPDASISLGLDAQELYQELQNCTARFAKFAQTTEQAGAQAGGGFMAGIKKGFSGIGASLGGLKDHIGGLIGGYLGFQGFEKLLSDASEIHHTSERFGLDAEQLQKIANVAKTTGLSMDEVARAMTLLTINAQQALAPTSKQAVAMQQLHINAQQFAKLNPEQKILALADAYSKSGQDGTAFAAVSDLIGRRNTAMIPLLQLGSAEIRKQGAEFHTMSEAEIKDLHNLDVEQKKYVTNIEVGFGKALVAAGHYFKFIHALMKPGGGLEAAKAEQLELDYLADPSKRPNQEEKTPHLPTESAAEAKDKLGIGGGKGGAGGGSSEKDDSDIARIRELSRPKSGFDEVRKLIADHQRERAREEKRASKASGDAEEPAPQPPRKPGDPIISHLPGGHPGYGVKHVPGNKYADQEGLVTGGLETFHLEGSGGLSPHLSDTDFHKQFQGRGDTLAAAAERDAVARRKREIAARNEYGKPLFPEAVADGAHSFNASEVSQQLNLGEQFKKFHLQPNLADHIKAGVAGLGAPHNKAGDKLTVAADKLTAAAKEMHDALHI
jgi:hypothetical protein